MTQTKYEFTGLSTREGFNRSLRHFKLVGEVVGDFESRRNLADILNALHEAKRLEANQVAPVVNALCVGHPKYSYFSRSHNLTRNVEDSGPIAAAVGEVERRGPAAGLLPPGPRAHLDQPQEPPALGSGGRAEEERAGDRLRRHLPGEGPPEAAGGSHRHHDRLAGGQETQGLPGAAEGQVQAQAGARPGSSRKRPRAGQARPGPPCARGREACPCAGAGFCAARRDGGAGRGACRPPRPRSA